MQICHLKYGIRFLKLLFVWLSLTFCFPIPSTIAKEANLNKKLQTAKLFHSTIYPLFKQRCFGCHGEGKELEGELNMLSRPRLLEGGASGQPAIVPGQPDASPLYQSVLRTGDLVMPPKERNRLTEKEVAALHDWILAGAPWPEKNSPETQPSKETTAVTTSGGLSESWTHRQYQTKDLWAYRAFTAVEPPRTADNQHPIDAFLQAKLNEKEILPAPAADRRTWLRRATFDLLGLPPAPQEIENFLTDNSSDTYKNTIDRLLANPHYGERMAQHWLDVVRYADTAGYSNDWERPHAWRYRDYVVRAFNDDKPYDRFIVEQLAGDELPEQNTELKIAVGFLRSGPWEQTAMSVAALTRQQYLDDVTNHVGVTFLAQEMSCCRCHDHKFDPLPTRDYYRLQAIFAGTHFDEAKTAFLPQENQHNFSQYKTELRRMVDTPDQIVSEDIENNSYTRVKKKSKQYQSRAKKRFQPIAFSVKNEHLQPIHILRGGALDAPVEPVEPGFLTAINIESPTVPQQAAGRRLALARWIADPQNPLTARVMVNRIWQMHFGRGIVATPNTFGKMGAKPSHPELLDWLANKFVTHGWSVKHMHRLIMTSQAYQRSSRHTQYTRLNQFDPDNKLLAYYPPRRLQAEELRDAMLSVSGELNRELGGPPIFPKINWEVAFQPRHVMGATAPAYQPSPQRKDRHRRTLYAFHCRTLSDPLLTAFNRPDEDFSCAQRDETTVTPQVFALLNGANVHARALAFAASLESQANTPEQQIELAFQRAFGRLPTAKENKQCLAHLEKMLVYHQKHVPQSWPLPKEIDRQMIDEMTGKPFQWQERLVNLEHYQRDLMPWQTTPEIRALSELCLVLLNSNEFIYVY